MSLGVIDIVHTQLGGGGGQMRTRGNHALCRRSIRASFEPKIPNIEPEMAEFWPIYQWDVA